MLHGVGVTEHKPTLYHGSYFCHWFLHTEDIRSHRQECAIICHPVATSSTESGWNTPSYLGDQQYTVAKTLEAWSHAEVYSVISFLWAKHLQYWNSLLFHTGVWWQNNETAACEKIARSLKMVKQPSMMIITMAGPSCHRQMWPQYEWKKWLWNINESPARSPIPQQLVEMPIHEWLW